MKFSPILVHNTPDGLVVDLTLLLENVLHLLLSLAFLNNFPIDRSYEWAWEGETGVIITFSFMWWHSIERNGMAGKSVQ